MKGYVAKKGDRWYAIIYQGLDPVTGRELRSWHPVGTSRKDAVRLAARLARELNGRNDEGRSLTFGAYLSTRWLPGKKLELAHSTWDGYRSGVFAPIISRASTTRNSTRPTDGIHLHRRRCRRSISSSAAPSTTPCVEA